MVFGQTPITFFTLFFNTFLLVSTTNFNPSSPQSVSKGLLIIFSEIFAMNFRLLHSKTELQVLDLKDSFEPILIVIQMCSPDQGINENDFISSHQGLWIEIMRVKIISVWSPGYLWDDEHSCGNMLLWRAIIFPNRLLTFVSESTNILWLIDNVRWCPWKFCDIYYVIQSNSVITVSYL